MSSSLIAHAQPLSNGYIQISPVVKPSPQRTRRGLSRKVKPLPQSGHRIAVIAFHSEDSKNYMLNNG
ncbi:hypothetical protein E4U55_000067 [Claviceps digitariae]|nr:hypothetical protein E4U55_000067 [Claviceps digitariae]